MMARYLQFSIAETIRYRLLVCRIMRVVRRTPLFVRTLVSYRSGMCVRDGQAAKIDQKTISRLKDND